MFINLFPTQPIFTAVISKKEWAVYQQETDGGGCFGRPRYSSWAMLVERASPEKLIPPIVELHKDSFFNWYEVDDELVERMREKHPRIKEKRGFRFSTRVELLIEDLKSARIIPAPERDKEYIEILRDQGD